MSRDQLIAKIQYSLQRGYWLTEDGRVLTIQQACAEYRREKRNALLKVLGGAALALLFAAEMFFVLLMF